MSKRLFALTSAALVSSAVASASAGVVVTHATVNHAFTLYPYPTGTVVTNSTPLDASSPGGTFSTLNNNAVPTANGLLGVTSNLGFFGGAVRLDATDTGAAHATGHDEYHSTTTGSIDFDTGGGLLSLGASFADLGGGLGGSGSVRVTSLSTGAYWNVVHMPTSGDTVTGTLPPTAAPAGAYELTWNWSGSRMAGIGGHGVATVNIAVTPEPVTAAAVLAVGGIIARRRR